MMKSFVSLLMAVFLCFSLAAQETDSVMLEKVMKLKTEVSKLKAGQKKLNSRMLTSNKKTDAALEEIVIKTSENREAIDKANAGLSEIGQLVDANKKQADQDRETLGEWAKKMLMILGIVFLFLFVILLVLIIVNRGRIARDYLKLEAKVDNTRNAIEVEIRDVLKKHEEDLATLKASMDKSKK